jgi:hypothetical protein
MASIDFNIGRTIFTYEGTESLPISTYDPYLRSVRRPNIGDEFPGAPVDTIWPSYLPATKDLNYFNEFTPGRKYEVNALAPFTLEY